MSDPVLHIQLRDWADVAVLAPLSAHTLAKIATGLCDDTLTCVLRAWDFGHTRNKKGKPLVLAPAMNTAMWEHPLTRLQLETIQGFWKKGGRSMDGNCLIRIVEPQVKTLACGEVGNGAMASVECIVNVVEDVLKSKEDT
jgi:Phosphopantothenoylcysteine synthetase/decarboxylase